VALGEDPLRPDADATALSARVRASKKSIGALIMDQVSPGSGRRVTTTAGACQQRPPSSRLTRARPHSSRRHPAAAAAVGPRSRQSFFAGPGNIYRAEILNMARVHPETPGRELDGVAFDRVWAMSVALLRRGYEVMVHDVARKDLAPRQIKGVTVDHGAATTQTGSILTVDDAADPPRATPGARRYIYNAARCARCGHRVRSWDMGGRTCYACEARRLHSLSSFEEAYRSIFWNHSL
jgi:formamidopyrimidine-DNA glycosylase